jgi:phage terminase small subunit
MSLTSKQKQFCNNVVSGMTAKDAYINAYNTKSSDRVCINEASKLMLREDIQEYIDTLTKPLQRVVQQQVISEREKKRTFLWDMINNPTTDNNDKLRAMDILNKMDSEYININKNIDENKTQINNLDTSTLLKLVK